VPQPFLGFFPPECSPHKKRAPLSGPLLPCSHPPACLRAPALPCHPRFPRRPRPQARWPGFPENYGLSFNAPEAAFPVRPGQRRRNRIVPPTSPASKPRSSCESVLTESSCLDPEVATLLGFRPSRACPPSPGILCPVRGTKPRTCIFAAAPTHRPANRSPRDRVDLLPPPKRRGRIRRRACPPKRSTRTASRRLSLLP